MKRPVITAEVTDTATGEVLATETKGAWNSALTALAGMVRAIARDEGQLYSRSTWARENAVRFGLTAGDTFTGTWTGDRTGRSLTTSLIVVSV